MTIRDRIADLVIAALVGWWALLGLLALYAIGRYLGWWAVGAMVVAAVVDMARWPRGWRPW